MKEDIQEKVIYKSKIENIFNSDKEYIIPLYQRPFAWEDKELIQLIEDISDNCIDGAKYYIGSLVVAARDQYYEVIDGQQRLTSLFLLLSSLGLEVKHTLHFACRDKSNYTLDNIAELNSNSVDKDKLQDSILNGIKIINAELSKTKYCKAEFIKKLKDVVIYQIVVPKHTDMNRYFEIMNTRGEQLEQHDILKANLMSYLRNDKKKKLAFAEIWEACSNMDGYLQMNFSKGKRIALFGWNWRDIPTTETFSNYLGTVELENKEQAKSIAIITRPNFTTEKKYLAVDESGKDVNVRFESIIDFPYFLIHSLKVFVKCFNLESVDGKPLCESLLNDKKLNIYFKRVLSSGLYEGKRIDPKWFAEEFILHLARMRYLFDRYIIKREYLGDSQDGEWSLKSLNVSGQAGNKKAYFYNTNFRAPYGRDDFHSEEIHIQAALRVSYTSPKVMHWITKLLIWLSDDSNLYDNIVDYISFTESIASQSVKEDFFDVCSNHSYKMGTGTPHIVFNFLDYLIWKSAPQKYNDFVFEFRNSVEHWYPRNPSESELEIWSDGGVDRFGNLCIIQRNVNSKFSNLPPEGKKSSYDKMIEKGSLKLRLMSSLTIRSSEKTASMNWRMDACEKHEQAMIQILAEACGLTQ